MAPQELFLARVGGPWGCPTAPRAGHGLHLWNHSTVTKKLFLHAWRVYAPSTGLPASQSSSEIVISAHSSFKTQGLGRLLAPCTPQRAIATPRYVKENHFNPLKGVMTGSHCLGVTTPRYRTTVLGVCLGIAGDDNQS